MNPVLLVVRSAQSTLLRTRDRHAIDIGTQFLGEYTEALTVVSDQNNRDKKLTTSPQARDILEQIVANHTRLLRDPYTNAHLPGRYNGLAAQTIPQILGRIDRGFEFITVSPYIGERNLTEEEENKVNAETIRWNDWSAQSQAIDPNDPAFLDKLIEMAKGEPRATGHELFYERKLAGIALRDMERMQGTPEGFGAIADHLGEALESVQFGRHREMYELLFFTATRFYDDGRQLGMRNARLLGLLNRFQELFAYRLVDPNVPEEVTSISPADVPEAGLRSLLNKVQSLISRQPKKAPYYETRTFPDTDRRIQKILAGMRERETHTFMHESLQVWVSDPFGYYDDYNGDRSKVIGRPEFVIEAFGDYILEKGLDLKDAPNLSEIGKTHLQTQLIPRLRERLNQFGVMEKFQKALSETEHGIANEKPYEERLLASLKRDFEANAGGAFLETLTDKLPEIDAITNSLWQELLAGNVHYLPMAFGVNVIDFSQNSTPSLLGLQKLEVIRLGTPQEWSLQLRFKFKNSEVLYPAVLDRNGTINFNIPLQQEIPDLFVMLKNIGTLAIRDLMIQNPSRERNEQGALPTAVEKSGERDEENPDEELALRELNEFLNNVIKSKGRLLPRTQQTDKRLIRDVAKKRTGQPPRVVEIHRSLVSGAKRYVDLVGRYHSAVERNVPAEELTRLQLQIEEARAVSYQASAEKRHAPPASMQLMVIMDPVTDEERYVQTWVIEHTRPTPLPEELASPVLMFERHYKNSSGLAFLDQLKPWFIGQ